MSVMRTKFVCSAAVFVWALFIQLTNQIRVAADVVEHVHGNFLEHFILFTHVHDTVN